MVKTKLLKNEEKRNWIYGISFVLQALKNAFIKQNWNKHEVKKIRNFQRNWLYLVCVYEALYESIIDLWNSAKFAFSMVFCFSKKAK